MVSREQLHGRECCAALPVSGTLRASGAGLSGTVEAGGNEQLHYSRLNKG